MNENENQSHVDDLDYPDSSKVVKGGERRDGPPPEKKGSWPRNGSTYYPSKAPLKGAVGVPDVNNT